MLERRKRMPYKVQLKLSGMTSLLESGIMDSREAAQAEALRVLGFAGQASLLVLGPLWDPDPSLFFPSTAIEYVRLVEETSAADSALPEPDWPEQ
jgi:hypothetical protein